MIASTPPSLAVIFPGQGSQRAGMARDFHEQSAVARAVFEEASDALSFDIGALCFNEDPRLDLTEYTQPAIVTAELAMLRAVSAEFGVQPGAFGGHSLGEYTALAAAGVLSVSDAVQVARRRGKLMQAAVPEGKGAMTAVVSPDILSRDLDAVLADLAVQVANRNSTDQVVLSGLADAMPTACARIEALLEGAPCRLVSLNVSAPFHSRMMEAIEPEFRGVLEGLEPRIAADRAGCVTSNFTGAYHGTTTKAIIEALTRQIGATVDWIANMRVLGAATTLCEIGPNRPLRNFFKTLGREVTSIVSFKHAEAAFGRAAVGST